MKVLYATDMDRTIVFSQRFLEEYPTSAEYEVAETKDERVISYVATNVKGKLTELNNHTDVEVVPVTTRSKAEYERINIGLNNKYAIISNGGIILKDGEPMKEWEEYLRDKVNRLEMMDAFMDLGELDSVCRKVDIIDGKYLFTKTDDPETFDLEINALRIKYPELNFTRQVAKIYGIPKAFSKSIALEWLKDKLGAETVVASGDSELDIPMLQVADYPFVPEHGALAKTCYVSPEKLIPAGIDSALYTMKKVDELIS